MTYSFNPNKSVSSTDINFSGARVNRTTVQSIADITDVAIQFNVEDYDTDVYHDTVTNNTRLTAPIAGYYEIKGRTEWAANSTGQRELKYQTNGAGLKLMSSVDSVVGATMLNFSDEVFLNAGDYIEVIVQQSSGVALDITSADATMSYRGK